MLDKFQKILYNKKSRYPVIGKVIIMNVKEYFMRYEIKGEPLPVVIVYLEAGESIKCEKGAMSWMTPNMKMATGAGSVGKAFSRMFSGESMFQNTYTAEGGPGMIAFASSFPGSIIPVDVSKGDFLSLIHI